MARSALTLDSRGTGKSEKPNTPYGTELFALDVVAVLDYLGVHGPTSTSTARPRADARPGNSQPATRTWCTPGFSAAHHPVDGTASNATAS
ncbi:alpha/beta fold hydrolase [Streptomyces rubiginosohelvolus]|uniref:alpha/beta fold hydrolase n=1 Tax=Streptomyces rubiginosohelvolus TaxID=67362 RepID=UPI00364E5B9A